MDPQCSPDPLRTRLSERALKFWFFLIFSNMFQKCRHAFCIINNVSKWHSARHAPPQKLYRRTHKIHRKSIQNPLQIPPRSPPKQRSKKQSSKNIEKTKKNTENGLPKGSPKGDNSFRTYWGSSPDLPASSPDLPGPLGANMAPRPLPGASQTPPNPHFWWIWVPFWINFSMICEVFCIRLAHIFRPSLLLSLHLFCLRAHTPTIHDPRSSANVWARWRGWPAGQLDPAHHQMPAVLNTFQFAQSPSLKGFPGPPNSATVASSKKPQPIKFCTSKFICILDGFCTHVLEYPSFVDYYTGRQFARFLRSIGGVPLS